MSQSKKTRPAVFIIESLCFDDEDYGRFEGRLLEHHLELAGITARYFYFRTDTELDVLLKRFHDSGFRYLHLSCHGSREAVQFTLSELEVQDFALRVSGVLRNRRLFLSACKSANDRLAQELFMQAPDCYSMIGPARDVDFRSAAIYWASFYHLLLAGDKTGMNRSQVADTAQRLSSLFMVPVNCFFSCKSNEEGFTKIHFPNKLLELRRHHLEKVLKGLSSRRVKIRRKLRARRKTTQI